MKITKLWSALCGLILGAINIAYALPTDNQQPATLNADTVSYNRNTGIGNYVGHVVIKQGSTLVQADKLNTYTNTKTNTISKAVAFGNLAHFQTLPKEGEQVMDAYAEEIDYYPSQKVAILIGNAKITQGDNVLTSDKVTYDMQHDQVTTESLVNSKQRTTIVVHPNQTSQTTRSK